MAVHGAAATAGASIGLGCHLEPRLAVSRALAELNQGVASDLKFGKDAEAMGFDEAHARWLKEATVKNQPYLRPLKGAPQRGRFQVPFDRRRAR